MTARSHPRPFPARRAGLQLLARCLPGRRPLLALLTWSVLEAAPALVSGVSLARAVDRFRSGAPDQALAWLVVPAVAMALGAWASTRLYRVLAAVVEEVRDGLSTAVVDGELRRIARTGRATTALFTQLTDQVDQVRTLLAAQLRSLRGTLAPLVAAAVGLTVLNPLLAAAVLTPTLVALLLYSTLLPTVVSRSHDRAVAMEVLGADTTALVGALPQIRGLGVTRWATDRFALRTDAVAAAELRLNRAQIARRVIVALGAHLPLLAVLLVGSHLMHSGRISVGDLVGATTYVLTVSAPALGTLVNTGGSWLVQMLVVLDRLALVAAGPNEEPTPEPDVQPLHHRLTDRPTAGQTPVLVTENLSFAYRSGARPVLDRVSLRLRRGELLAVTGPSGVGKSTFARLLSGALTPSAGSVTLRAETRLCLLPQQAYVFTGSLTENLTYLAAGPVPVARLDESLRTVRLERLADRLGGLDAEIRPGDLTPAERQQVVLARALLSPADLVVLDEATCHLDAATEHAVHQALRETGRTLVVIAHRLDVTERADQVLWLDGFGARHGSRDELLSVCSDFRDLVQPAAAQIATLG